jgi:hypothetical protein
MKVAEILLFHWPVDPPPLVGPIARRGGQENVVVTLMAYDYYSMQMCLIGWIHCTC